MIKNSLIFCVFKMISRTQAQENQTFLQGLLNGIFY